MGDPTNVRPLTAPAPQRFHRPARRVPVRLPATNHGARYQAEHPADSWGPMATHRLAVVDVAMLACGCVALLCAVMSFLLDGRGRVLVCLAGLAASAGLVLARWRWAR